MFYFYIFLNVSKFPSVIKLPSKKKRCVKNDEFDTAPGLAVMRETQTPVPHASFAVNV